MKTTKATNLSLDLDDGSNIAITLPIGTNVTITPKAPEVIGKYVMLNCINWGSNPLTNLPVSECSELTYFVLTVQSSGALIGGNDTLEKKFVADVHAGGKKATFSVAGGSQNKSFITTAVVSNRVAFIDAIAKRITSYGYDGVTVDIENTNINPVDMVNFFLALRTRLDIIKKNLIIGVYVQPYQIGTVWSKIEQAESAITWLAPMIYDYPYTVESLKADTLAWLPKLNGKKEKLMCGVATNYLEDPVPLSITTYEAVLNWVNEYGLKGVGVWENTIYVPAWRAITKKVFKNII